MSEVPSPAQVAQKARHTQQKKKGAASKKALLLQNPSKTVLDAQNQSRKRIVERKKNEVETVEESTQEETDEKEKFAKLIGQLKAAEARNRIRITRLTYELNRNNEVKHLISCQPSALKAVRLQEFLTSKKPSQEPPPRDSLKKLERRRLEIVLADTKGNELKRR